ncbi:hypothetical protein VTO73DRAFT_15009 [Trametes versicolor]
MVRQACLDVPASKRSLSGCVTEGFQRTVSVPADPSILSKRLPFTQTPSFISANDAMRDLFAARAAKNKGTASAPSSPQQRPKRVHNPESDAEDADVDADDLDLDLGLDDEEGPVPPSKLSAEEKSKRAIRPLKRSASRPAGVATQSLPASMFRFSYEGANRTGPAATQITEEDWSESFGEGGGPELSADLEI